MASSPQDTPGNTLKDVRMDLLSEVNDDGLQYAFLEPQLFFAQVI